MHSLLPVYLFFGLGSAWGRGGRLQQDSSNRRAASTITAELRIIFVNRLTRLPASIDWNKPI